MLLKSFARCILRKEIEYKEARHERSLQSHQNTHDKLQKTQESLAKLKNHRKHLVAFLENNSSKNTSEIHLFKDELIILSYPINNPFDFIELTSETVKKESVSVVKIEFIKNGNIVKICDFTSTERGKGYGKFLLQCVLVKAKKVGIKRIWGEISEEDFKNSPRLISFYERLGFHYTAYPERKGTIIGEINQYFEEDANSP